MSIAVWITWRVPAPRTVVVIPRVVPRVPAPRVVPTIVSPRIVPRVPRIVIVGIIPVAVVPPPIVPTVDTVPIIPIRIAKRYSDTRTIPKAVVVEWVVVEIIYITYIVVPKTTIRAAKTLDTR